jgi:hypothetical protein
VGGIDGDIWDASFAMLDVKFGVWLLVCLMFIG